MTKLIIANIAAAALALSFAATPAAARPHHERYWFDSFDWYDEYNYPAIGIGCCSSDSYAYDDDDYYGDDDDDYGDDYYDGGDDEDGDD